MITRDPQLLNALGTVISAHLKLETDRSSEAQQQFYAALRKSTREFEGKHDACLASYVCQYWLRHFSVTLVNASYHEPYCADIDAFIELALDHGLVRDLIEEEQAARVLACVLAVRVMLREDGSPHQEHSNVAKVMKAWFDVAPPTDAVDTLAGCIDYLYGPGVWALYSADVAWPEDMTGHLYKQGLLPSGPRTATPSAAAAIDSHRGLPSDMLDDFR